MGPPSRPSGLPMATAGSPMLKEAEDPISTAVMSALSTNRTAMSVTGSEPITRAGKRAPSAKVTDTSVAPAITWWLVMM